MRTMGEKRSARVKYASILIGAVLALTGTPAMAAGTPTPPHRAATSGSGVGNPPGVAWCSGERPGSLAERERLQGSNLMRLRAAQDELAPGFAAGTATTGLRILADYQDQLGKPRPDASLAASYLAQVSTVPITAARLLRVNALLCVSTTRALARKIEIGAEAQRQQMSR